MTLLDEPVVTVDLEPEVEVDEQPAPRGLLARLVPVLVVFALLGLIGGAGTFAAFSASTDNPATFTTGALVLSNEKTSTTACLSTDDAGAAVNESDCEQLFDVSVRKPGDEASATLTLKNVGTIDAVAFKVFADGTCSSTTTGTYSGSANLCTRLRLSIQEYSDAGFTTPSSCHYGGGNATTCAYDDAGRTVSAFLSSHADWTGGLSLGALAVDAERYVRVGVKLDGAEGNDVQGRAATFSLTWRIEQ